MRGFCLVIGMSGLGLCAYAATVLMPSSRPHSAPPPSRPVVGVQAVPYDQLPEHSRWTNASWQSDMRQLVPQISQPSPTSREQVRLIRQEHRAYAGAPPQIPHRIDQMRPDSCLACHGEGLQLRSGTASAISHAKMTSCTQCHAAPAPDFLHENRQPLAENTFVGQTEIPGPRAWAGAPPQIPHSTHMRENCLSCHGPNGQPPLRTSHPERVSCLQCHTSAANSLWKEDLAPIPPRNIP